MASSSDQLDDLLDAYDITIADIEYIVKYLDNEDISPQLAMRRIKSFEQIKQKLEESDHKDKIASLEEELNETKEQVFTLQQKKKELIEKNKELENKNDLLDSEREELQHQLTVLQEMHMDDEEDEQKINDKLVKFIDDLDEMKSEREDFIDLFDPIQKILQTISEDEEYEFPKAKFERIDIAEKGSVEPLNELLSRFIDDLEELTERKPKAAKIIDPIQNTLQIIKDNTTYEFPLGSIENTFEDLISSPSTVDQKAKSSTSDKKQEEMVSTSSKEEEQDTTQTSTEQRASELSSGLEEIDGQKSQNDKSEGDIAEEDESEKSEDQKTQEVLDLFLEFIDEATNDENFKDRVSTICDMDEAYEYLGSIGLSQVYSYSSKGIDKKEELEKLLKSWKKDGVPR